jgi:S-adenosylmethionine:tRNA ribosyltransferase-isomerase
MDRLPDYDYALPRDRIAQAPLPRRSDSRLMVLDRAGGTRRHARFRDLPELLRPGDLLVMNDSRVLPARLIGVRGTGGRIAVLLVRPREGGAAGEPSPGAGGPPRTWEVLAEHGGRLVGETLAFGRLRGTMLAWEGARGRMRFDADPLGPRAGGARRAPLPPYIKRPKADDARRAADLRRYQTVYARPPGSIAAPTAGLHFTRALLARLARRGVRTAAVTLHVGPGTFQPVKADRVDDHRMEAERYALGAAAARAIREAKAEGRRVVAVGTTTVRALESAARGPGPVPHEAWTDLFIRPPFAFRVVDALVTNFHLPKSTLLMLVSAFAGRERVLDAYAEAVREGYRFYSYGDAMLIG